MSRTCTPKKRDTAITKPTSHQDHLQKDQTKYIEYLELKAQSSLMKLGKIWNSLKQTQQKLPPAVNKGQVDHDINEIAPKQLSTPSNPLQEQAVTINVVREVCNSYPLIFLTLEQVCSNIKNLEDLISYREKFRIPALVYLFRSNFKSEQGHPKFSSLWRSGQVKAGILNKQCQADIDLIRAIGSLTFNKDNTANKVFIFDCRPYINAIGNRVNGKGYLDEDNYNIYQVHFANIDNIHVMREALDEMLDSFKNYSGDQPIVSWFGHLQKILKGAKTVADRILRGDSVIVNCSDGWDRTPPSGTASATSSSRGRPTWTATKHRQSSSSSSTVCTSWCSPAPTASNTTTSCCRPWPKRASRTSSSSSTSTPQRSTSRT